MTKSNAHPALKSGSRHFLELYDFERTELETMIESGLRMKKDRAPYAKVFESKSLGLIFDKRSVRTRDSFMAGFNAMGGLPVDHLWSDLKCAEKESVEHIAGTFSQYFCGVAIRISSPQTLNELVQHSEVPVINAMTDDSHPCQIMADLMTLQEETGRIDGKTIVFAGDCDNNIAKTYGDAAALFNFNMVFSGPREDCKDIATGQNVTVESDLKKAAKDADVIVTDVWTSMGQEGKKETTYLPYQVNRAVMQLAKPTALFMHCMPVAPCYTKEVTPDVLKSPNSVILKQAANRMWAQNGIMLNCLR